jgi:Fe-S cluster assembly ATP-binding protein
MKPKLVIMDEPDSGIDIEAINNIFKIIEELKGLGTTVVFITHSIAVLDKAEHGFLICDGKLRDKGTKPEIEKYFKNKCIKCDHPNEPKGEFSE